MMNKEELAKDDVLEWVEQEEKVVEKLQKIPHPFICKVHETFRTKAHVVHVMEFVPGGDLAHYLKRVPGGKLSVADAKFYFAEVALAINHLHTHHIMYRDLKPDNVLLNMEGHVALADFGFAKCVDPMNPEHTAFCGSLEFLAPEMINSDVKPYSYEVDWWSAAVLLYNLLTGQVPWTSDNSVVCYDKICTAPLPKRKLGKEEFSFLTKILHKDPSVRLCTFEALKAHPFMIDIDWDKLEKGEVPPPFVPDLAGDDTKYFDKDLTSLPAQISTTRGQQSKKATPAPPQPDKKKNGHGEGARKKRK
jgi:serine/threonine protein kinase